MAGLKDKLKVKGDLKDQIESEKGGRKTDNRILNFFDMKYNDKMRVLIVPDANGSVWKKFKKHGPNLGVRGVETIGCANDDGGDGGCEACQVGYDYLDQWREHDDDSYKKEAKRWFARDYMIMNVVVLESPISINEDSDGNQCKVVYVPFAIEKIIKENIEEGLLDSDDLVSTPLIIKKTQNSGGRADYSSSYFDRKPVKDEELDAFDDMMVEPFDLETIDIVPEQPSHKQLQEWVEKAREKVEAADNGEDNGSSGKGSKSSGKSSGVADSPRERLRKSKAKKEESNDSDDSDDNSDEPDNAPEPEPETKAEDEPEPKAESSKPTSGIRDRLNRVRDRS